MIVAHEFPVPAPPGDPISLVEPAGWHRFSTDAASAWVHEIDGPGFILHWIESQLPGHGSTLLAEIGRWADTARLTGYLLCERQLARFYERDGWTVSTRNPDWLPATSVEMMRWPVLSGRRVIDVATSLV